MLKVIALIAVIGMMCSNAFPLSEEEATSQWNEFKSKFQKNYDEEEDGLRKQIFLENLEKITAHNKRFEAGEVTFTQAINKFADYTPEQIQKTRGFGVIKKPTQ